MLNLECLSAPDNYEVRIEKGLFSHIAEHLSEFRGHTAYVLTDANVSKLYAERLYEQLTEAGINMRMLTIPAGENSKQATFFFRIFDKMREQELDCSDCVLAFGGGVVGDLAGLAASVYMRGIPLIQVPTTVMAMTDSAVGGKNGVNVSGSKNLMGSVYPPYRVLVDPELLQTLPRREQAAGFAEVAKYACICDEWFFRQLEGMKDLDEMLADMDRITVQCCRYKEALVYNDLYDRGSRRLLSFGHTLGHALEMCADGALLHGEAVALGMLAMTHWCERSGIASDGSAARLEALLRKMELPLQLPEALDEAALREQLAKDSKCSGEEIGVVLLQDIGSAYLRTLPLQQVTNGLLENMRPEKTAY